MPRTSELIGDSDVGFAGHSDADPELRLVIRQSNSSDDRTGFVRLAANPVRWDSAGSRRWPDELSKKSIVSAVEGSAFRARASSMPSMPGMFRSTTPRSNARPPSAAVERELERLESVRPLRPLRRPTTAAADGGSCGWSRCRPRPAPVGPRGCGGPRPCRVRAHRPHASERQLEPEGRPLARRTREPEPASHELHQLPADGQAEPGAAVRGAWSRSPPGRRR